jgi:hypothetical protein
MRSIHPHELTGFLASIFADNDVSSKSSFPASPGILYSSGQPIRRDQKG